MPPERQLCLTLLLGLLALAVPPAAAQDTLGEPRASDAFSWPVHPENLVAAAPEAAAREWAPYGRPEQSGGLTLPAQPFLRRPTTAPGAIMRLTQLAGIFMGRISPLSLGSMRICIKLDVL